VPVELRRAKPPDAEFLLELLADDDVRQFLGPRTAATRDEVLEEIGRSLADPGSFGRFVIESDGEPAGMLGFHVANERNRIARLERLAVHPRFRGRRLADEAARLFQQHHDAEVEELGDHRAGPRGGEEDVGGLEVAVDDAHVVHRRHGREHRQQRVDGGGRGEHLQAIEAGVERLAVEALHRDVGHALLAADVEDRADVRVRDARGDLRLAHEAHDQLRVRAGDLVQHLERDRALQGLELEGLVDRAEGPSAEQTADLVAAEAGARGEHVVGRSVLILHGLRGVSW
jgi:N-acetylglutamate synthase-like GNAT family acetyltransferase